MVDQDCVALHVFCDASPEAYSTAVYIVTASRSSLVMSKTRVAPIKTPSTSLPRLELLGCLIGSRLIACIRAALPAVKNAPCYCWTDTTIALAWIKAPVDANNRIWLPERLSRWTCWHRQNSGGMDLSGLYILRHTGPHHHPMTSQGRNLNLSTHALPQRPLLTVQRSLCLT